VDTLKMKRIFLYFTIFFYLKKEHDKNN